MSQTQVDWRNVEDTVYEGVMEQMKNSAGFIETFANTLNVKAHYVEWKNVGTNAELTPNEKVVRVLDLWLQHEDGSRKERRVLVEHLKRNQRAKSCQPLIYLLEKENVATTQDQSRTQTRSNNLGSTSQGIEDEQWDAFLAFVQKLLEEHPIGQADTVMALKLGSKVYQHYDTWQGQGNMMKPFPAKVTYLLNYWESIKNHTSMNAMVMDLDEKLKDEASFNMMREKIKQRFLR